MKKTKYIWLRNILRKWLGIEENTTDIEHENSKINVLSKRVDEFENTLNNSS